MRLLTTILVMVAIHFVGPALPGRVAFGKKDNYKVGAYWGFGYMHYANQSDLMGIPSR